MKNILFIFLIVINFSVRGQTISWSKLFDIHSQNASGGFSSNSLFDNDGNIITPVIENNYLNIYKLNSTNGEVIGALNTNFVSGQITNIIETTQNNYALIFNNAPQGLSDSYKILYFNSNLNITTISDLTFPFISNLNRILSFFKINHQLFITVNAFSSANYYLLEINSSNQLIQKYSLLDSITQDHVTILPNGNIIIDFTENHYHSLKCINPSSGQLIWQENYNNGDTINLNYITAIGNQDNIYLAHLVREWDNLGNPFDTMYLKKINSTTGEIMDNEFFHPASNCAIRIEDLIFNPNTSSVYISYLDCDVNPKIHLQQYNNTQQLVNETIIDSPNNLDSSSYLFFKTKLKMNNDGNLIFINRKFKDGNELENLYISMVTSDLTIQTTLELNIPPKNGDEIHTDIILQNGKLIITGFVPSVDPLISWEEIQYFVSMIDINGILENLDFEKDNLINVYPNPATNYIKLSSNEDNQYTRYTIYSSDGKLIMEGATYLNNQIDIEKLSSGNYIFNFSFENNQFNSIKFIKK